MRRVERRAFLAGLAALGTLASGDRRAAGRDGPERRADATELGVDDLAATDPTRIGAAPGGPATAGATDPAVVGPGARLTLVVGGPADSASGRFADLIAPLIEPKLLGPAQPAPGFGSADGPDARSRLRLETTGGADGVTAANAFEARANPDGSTALVVPGAAALAWLAGDPRVHFDTGLWVPALAAVAPAVLVGRPQAGGIAPGAAIRVGASTPAGRELPVLIALHLLGVRTEAVFGLHTAAESLAAFRDGRIDALLLAGTDVPARLATLGASGLSPLFALGPQGGGRDPELPGVATVDELSRRLHGRPLAGPLAPAFHASAAATRLDTAVVLPSLAAPDVVARWRTACDEVTGSLSLRSAVAAAALRPLAAPECVAAVNAVVAGETALLDLHRFLADRYGWRPA